MSTFFLSVIYSLIFLLVACEALSIGNERTINLHPIAIMHRIAQFGRTAVNADFVFS